MGSKRAVIVGLNKYQNPAFNLRGCVNDIRSLINVLTVHYAFPEENLTVLQDEKATKVEISREVTKLFQHIDENDVLIFAYCGHGTKYVPGDENVVEAIVPYETQGVASLLSNKDINAIARKAIKEKALQEKVNFTAIYDCCHSGKMFRTMSIGADGTLDIDVVNRVLDISDFQSGIQRELVFNDLFQVLSACGDEQTAADMRPDPTKNLSESRGAFSFVLHNLLRQNPLVSVGDLESKLVEPIRALVQPHVQVPVFAVQEAWKQQSIFTI